MAMVQVRAAVTAATSANPGEFHTEVRVQRVYEYSTNTTR